MTEIESNKAVIRRFVGEVIEKGNLDRLESYFAPQYVAHDPSNPTRPGGYDGVRAFVGMLHSGLQNLRYRVEQMVAEGDLVTYRFTLSGVQMGVFMGIPPTGRALSVGGVDIFRLEQGRIVESWAYADALGMLVQLGVLPPPGPPGPPMK